MFDSVTPWTAARQCQTSLSFTTSLSLLKLMSIESVILSYHLILCHHHLHLKDCPQSFSALGSFSVSRPFALGGQIIGASASIPPMNIQGWFPLGSTGLIFLQSKGFSRVFSSTTIWRHLFCGAHLAASYFKFRVQLRFFFLQKMFPYPFKSGLASLVSQTVKSLPAVWETWVRSLG